MTPGSISLVSKVANAVSLICTAASGGTAPYTYQWYRDLTAGFTPAAGNMLAGKTALTLTDSPLIPNQSYFYKVVATDSASPTPAAEASTAFEVDVFDTQVDQNQFAQKSIAGQIDLKVGPQNVVSCEIDVSQVGSVYPGQAVKIVDNSDGVPKVIACDTHDDNVLGFVAYDIKSRSFVKGEKVEVAIDGTCMYLFATTAVARGAQVTLDLSAPACVASANTGDTIVGWSFDKAAAYGSLVRIMIKTPSFKVA